MADKEAEKELENYGKYKVIGRIGKGSMGQVYKAQDPVLKREVAIKTMMAKTTTDSQLVQRFHREAQSAASLNHPNIITVFDFGEEQGQLYMAMELLKGKDLKDLIGTPRLVSLRQKLDLMEQIAEGVGFAHARGVIHRDLKPGNIHVQPNGRVKILDFGLARPEESEMTQAGMVMGTPNYMSPEQVRGEKADSRSDVFSLGAVFYEVVSSRRAFRAETMHKILEKVLVGQPESLREWTPDLPEKLVTVVERALNKNPADRFQDGSELAAALRAVRTSLSPEELDRGAPGLGLADPESGEAATTAGQATVLEAGGASVAARSVHGSTALKYARQPGSTYGATLSGRAATQIPEVAPAPPRSALPLYLSLGVIILAIGAGAVYWKRHQQAVSPELETEQVSMLTEVLIASQIELAELELDSKQYQEAIDQAQQALTLDPSNADAQAIVQRAQSTLEELTQVAARARAAFEAGDTAGASEALGRVLFLDPRHPVVAELSPRLNQYFQDQARSAQSAMDGSRTAAARFQADARQVFDRAEGLFNEGRQALGRGEFAVATQKLLEARDNYDRVRREGEAAERARNAAQVAAAQREAEAAARAAAAAAAATSTLPSTLPAPTTTLRRTAQQLPQVTQPPVTAPPATVITVPPSTAPPRVTTPPVPTMSPQEVALRGVLAQYTQAYEGRDLALLRSIRTNLPGDEEKKLQAAFKAIKSWQVGITVESVTVAGSKATIVVARQDVVNGRETPKMNQTFNMIQSGDKWLIDSTQ